MIRPRVLIPATLTEALTIMDSHPDALPLAGGTDLMPLFKAQTRQPAVLVSLHKLGELRNIRLEEGTLRIGAMATLSEVAASPEIRRRFPAIAQAARAVASSQIRNIATIGGNIYQERRCLFFNQSAHWRSSIAPCRQTGGEICHQVPIATDCRALYYSDLAPALAVYGASAEFFADGRWQTGSVEQLVGRLTSRCRGRPDQAGRQPLVTEFRVPLAASGGFSAFYKAGVRRAIDFAVVNAAVRCVAAGNSSISPRFSVFVGAMAPGLIELTDTAGLFAAGTGQPPEVLTQMLTRSAETELKAKMRPVKETAVTIQQKRRAAGVVIRAVSEALAGAQEVTGLAE